MSHKTTTIIAAFNFIGEAVAAFVAKQLGESAPVAQTPIAEAMAPVSHAETHSAADTILEAQGEAAVSEDAAFEASAQAADAADETSGEDLPATTGLYDNANKQKARIIATAFRRLSNSDYTYRTLAGIAAKAGVSADVAETVLRECEDFIFKSQRRTGAQLVGLTLDKAVAAKVGKVLGRLSDPTYALRSETALRDGVEDFDTVLGEIGYNHDLVTKTRRADGVKLYGIADGVKLYGIAA